MGEIAPEEKFPPLSTIFYYLMLDFYVKTGIRFTLRDKQLFEITEVEITGVNCISFVLSFKTNLYHYIDISMIFKSNADVGLHILPNLRLTFYVHNLYYI